MKRTNHAVICVLVCVASVVGTGCEKQAPAAAPPVAPAEGSKAKPASAEDPHAQHAQHGGHDNHEKHEALPADDVLPGQSVYQLSATLTDEHGKELALDAFRGKAVLITMFYSSCKSICPMLISQMRRIDEMLTPEQRARTEVVLVSLDPERDTPAQLAELRKRHEITGGHWHFTRTEASSVREIAALLGIRYRQLPDKEISHSPVITLLNTNGVLVTRTEDTVGEPKAMLEAVATLLAR